MTKDDSDTDLCSTVGFAFAERWDLKRFSAKAQDVADQDGPEAAKRFGLVLSLGERVQARLKTSDKTLANVFNFVMDQVAKEEQLDRVERAHLTDDFIECSAHGHQLNVELKLRQEQRQQVRKMVQAIEMAPAYDLDEYDINPDPNDDHGNIRTYHYTFSREAGPG